MSLPLQMWNGFLNVSKCVRLEAFLVKCILCAFEIILKIYFYYWAAAKNKYGLGSDKRRILPFREIILAFLRYQDNARLV